MKMALFAMANQYTFSGSNLSASQFKPLLLDSITPLHMPRFITTSLPITASVHQYRLLGNRLTHYDKPFNHPYSVSFEVLLFFLYLAICLAGFPWTG